VVGGGAPPPPPHPPTPNPNPNPDILIHKFIKYFYNLFILINMIKFIFLNNY
jgi:hypothetical protein